MNPRMLTLQVWILMVATGLVALLSGNPLPAQTEATNSLNADSAMQLFKQAAGKWTGTKIYNPDQTESTTSKITVLNRIESDQWLYFQIAERDDDGIKLAKGTTSFDPGSGKLVRRWFESGSADILSTTVSYNAEDRMFSYQWSTEGTEETPTEDDQPTRFGNDDGSPAPVPAMTFRVEVSIKDADTRVINAYSRKTSDDASSEQLISRTTLTRAKTSVAKKPNRSAGGDGSGTRSTAKTEDKKPAPKHTLIVKVFIASSQLQDGQEPEISLAPDDSEGERVDANTYRFEDLKGGVEYKVTGEFQTAGALRVKTTGEATHKFSKSAKTKITKTKILRLEGN